VSTLRVLRLLRFDQRDSKGRRDGDGKDQRRCEKAPTAHELERAVEENYRGDGGDREEEADAALDQSALSRR
jgi:hypothetical protein